MMISIQFKCEENILWLIHSHQLCDQIEMALSLQVVLRQQCFFPGKILIPGSWQADKSWLYQNKLKGNGKNTLLKITEQWRSGEPNKCQEKTGLIWKKLQHNHFALISDMVKKTLNPNTVHKSERAYQNKTKQTTYFHPTNVVDVSLELLQGWTEGADFR